MSVRCPGNWLSFLVRGKIPVTCLVFWAATSAFAQHLEVGIKTGVPLTDVLQTTATGVVTGIPFQAQTGGYTIGPVVDITVPGVLGIELGTMYKRINQQAPLESVNGFVPPSCADCEDGHLILGIQQITTRARSWEFPVAVQYHVPLRSIRPYVEGGISYNHVSDVLGGNDNRFRIVQPGNIFRPTVNSINRTGFLAGGGVEIRLRMIHLTPGLRYTHYDKVESFLPSPNAIDFLVGFQLLKF
jgi:opacity protein-like surface antigen